MVIFWNLASLALKTCCCPSTEVLSCCSALNVTSRSPLEWYRVENHTLPTTHQTSGSECQPSYSPSSCCSADMPANGASLSAMPTMAYFLPFSFHTFAIETMSASPMSRLKSILSSWPSENN